MKQQLGNLAVILLSATACTAQRECCPPPPENVVCETYIHRYGVPVSSEHWSEQGSHGQVVTTLDTGVTVTKNFEAGVQTGATTYTFPHSHVIEKTETYIDNVLTKDVVNYPSGSPMRETEYLASGNTLVTIWDDAGVPQSIEEYNQEQLVKGDYFTTNHQLESRVENGEGIKVVRDAYGEIISRDTIKDGKKVLTTTYHSNGAPKEIAVLVDDKIEGEKKIFHPKGEPQASEQWVNGKQHGITTLYKNGERFAEVPYENGVKEGVEKRYADDGVTVVQTMVWHRNQMHGPATTSVGNSVKTEYYVRDKLVNKLEYDLLTKKKTG